MVEVMDILKSCMSMKIKEMIHGEESNLSLGNCPISWQQSRSFRRGQSALKEKCILTARSAKNRWIYCFIVTSKWGSQLHLGSRPTGPQRFLQAEFPRYQSGVPRKAPPLDVPHRLCDWRQWPHRAPLSRYRYSRRSPCRKLVTVGKAKWAECVTHTRQSLRKGLGKWFWKGLASDKKKQKTAFNFKCILKTNEFPDLAWALETLFKKMIQLGNLPVYPNISPTAPGLHSLGFSTALPVL